MILTHLQELNRKKSKAYPASRQSLFETMEKQALSPLPKELYGFTKWIYGIKIPDDYHIEYLGSFYSVPYTFRFSTVDMRISSDGIEFLKNRQRIAYHLKIQPGQKNTIFEHSPHYRCLPASEQTADNRGQAIRKAGCKNDGQREHIVYEAGGSQFVGTMMSDH